MHEPVVEVHGVPRFGGKIRIDPGGRWARIHLPPGWKKGCQVDYYGPEVSGRGRLRIFSLSRPGQTGRLWIPDGS